ncbi:glycoside hydrolase, partial [Pluteus cervinus]
QGVYDWNKDQAGVYFLREASNKGVTGLTAFANSAPPALTAGRASCNSGFVTGSGNAYGAYLADVILHFKDQGINISYISAMNEPDSSFGPSPCGQEGMSVQPNQSHQRPIQSRGLSSVGILADESSNLGNANNNYATWLPGVASKVAALVHHTYDFPSDASYTSYVTNTRNRYPGKEVCCSLGNADGSGKGWSQGYDPTIKNALMFSGLMFQSFLIANEPHYDFWTLVSNPNSNGWNDGLIYYDPSFKSNGNYKLYIKKQYYTFKHFSQFVRPGSQRRPVNGSDAGKFTMVVFNPSTNTYSVLAMNPGSSDTSLSLTFPEAVCATKAYRTSAAEDFTQIGAATSNGGVWQMPLKSMSMTTYLLERRSC